MKDIDTHAPWVGGRELKALLYADDVVLFSTSRVGLRRGLHKLEDYCGEWKLKVNTVKSKILVVKKSQGGRRSHKGIWWYNEEKIEEVNSFSYLGVLIKEYWSWLSHQEVIINKTKFALISIRRLIFKSKNFQTEWLFKIFDIMIVPILAYGVEIWGAFMKKELLCRVGVELCRMILGVKGVLRPRREKSLVPTCTT